MDLEDQYMYIMQRCQKKIKCDNTYFIMDMLTFLPYICLSCGMMEFLCLKYTVGNFTRPSILCITTFIFNSFKKLSRVDNTYECMILQICNTCNHTWLCIGMSYFWDEVEEYYAKLNNFWWYYCLHLFLI